MATIPTPEELAMKIIRELYADNNMRPGRVPRFSVRGKFKENGQIAIGKG